MATAQMSSNRQSKWSCF